MIPLKADRDFYGGYFHGIEDIKEGQSIKQKALGTAKILSCLTIILPIIFGVGYLVAEHRLTGLKNLNTKVLNALKAGTEPNPKELMEFLAISVIDNNPENFKSAFATLNPENQKQFFTSMIEQGRLPEALVLIPEGIAQISIDFGSNPSQEMIENAISALLGNQNLKDTSHKVTFDFEEAFSKGVLTKAIEKRMNSEYSLSKSQSSFAHQNRAISKYSLTFSKNLF